MDVSNSLLNLLSTSLAPPEWMRSAFLRSLSTPRLTSVAAALVVGSLGFPLDAMATKKSALIRGCQNTLVKCSADCVAKYGKEGVHETPKEAACNKKCVSNHDACITRVNKPSDERAATLPTGLNPKGDRNPRCTPGVTCIPPVGGGLLDPGPAVGTQGPAATGAPLGAGGRSSSPGKIY
jgi:hypothetical protein